MQGGGAGSRTTRTTRHHTPLPAREARHEQPASDTSRPKGKGRKGASQSFPILLGTLAVCCFCCSGAVGHPHPFLTITICCSCGQDRLFRCPCNRVLPSARRRSHNNTTANPFVKFSDGSTTVVCGTCPFGGCVPLFAPLMKLAGNSASATTWLFDWEVADKSWNPSSTSDIIRILARSATPCANLAQMSEICHAACKFCCCNVNTCARTWPCVAEYFAQLPTVSRS